MDVEIVVAIGQYSVDVNAENTDHLFLADAQHRRPPRADAEATRGEEGHDHTDQGGRP
jgi:hypothetical protein